MDPRADVPTVGGMVANLAPPHHIRVGFADDRALTRGTMRTMLEGEPDIDVIPVADGATSVAHMLETYRPDVLVLDVAAADEATAAAVGKLRADAPDTQIVIATGEAEAEKALAALSAGAVALVAREELAESLLRAVRAAARGERYVSTRMTGSAGDGAGARTGLTPRETEVLRMIALGHTSVETAQALHLSPRTVETHRARIHKKLALATRAELVRYALRTGLLRV